MSYFSTILDENGYCRGCGQSTDNKHFPVDRVNTHLKAAIELIQALRAELDDANSRIASLEEELETEAKLNCNYMSVNRTRVNKLIELERRRALDTAVICRLGKENAELRGAK